MLALQFGRVREMSSRGYREARASLAAAGLLDAPKGGTPRAAA
jgi:hypothetical protein